MFHMPKMSLAKVDIYRLVMYHVWFSLRFVPVPCNLERWIRVWVHFIKVNWLLNWSIYTGNLKELLIFSEMVHWFNAMKVPGEKIIYSVCVSFNYIAVRWNVSNVCILYILGFLLNCVAIAVQTDWKLLLAKKWVVYVAHKWYVYQMVVSNSQDRR